MMTDEVIEYLRTDKYTGRISTRVLPYDMLPLKYIPGPCAFIINTGHSTTDGEHWIALFKPRHGPNIEYFDSYAFKPFNKEIYEFARINERKIIFNRRRIQHIFSFNCGKYCIFYLYLRARGFSMYRITKFFMKHLQFNDIIITKIFNKINKLF